MLYICYYLFSSLMDEVFRNREVNKFSQNRLNPRQFVSRVDNLNHYYLFVIDIRTS